MAQPVMLTMAEALANEPDFDAAEAVPITPGADPMTWLAVYAFNPLLDGATWDTDTWAPDPAVSGPFWYGEGSWYSIGHRVRGLGWERGAESSLDRPAVGTATLVLENLDGEVSSWSVGGEFETEEGSSITPGAHVTGPSWLEPGTLVRFGAFGDDGMAGHIWMPWFTGRVEALPEDTEDLVDGWVQLDLVELSSDLGNHNGAQQSARGAGEDLDARIARLLTDALWEAGSVVSADDVGDVATFTATTLAQNRLTELYLTGDSVGMRVLCGSDGKLRVTSPQPADAAVADLTFANYPTGDQLAMEDAVPYSSLDRLVNVAVAARIGSTEQTVQDLKSIRKFGRYDPGGSRDDLIVQADSTVRAMLRRIVEAGAFDTVGIQRIDVDVDQDPINLPSALALLASTGLETLTPFNVEWTHPSGNVFTLEVFMEGMRHTITAVEPGAAVKWTATLNTTKRI